MVAMWYTAGVIVVCALNVVWSEMSREDLISAREGGKHDCYDKKMRPQRCLPTFENAAFNMPIEATNTCGQNGPTTYCIQKSVQEAIKSCQDCTASGPYSHPAAYLTDFANQSSTWWQSETMYEDIQYPNQVNLTIHLRKSFDVTYVRLSFHSPRPESFAIYKRKSENDPWVPFQFYSSSCRDTYGLPDRNYAVRGEETRALCTSEYSDISPLTKGNVPFATLDGRPSAYFFDSSPELQDWVTATDVRITLDRLNTFGDEVFGDRQVLQSYYYAISDFDVGARCKCNGHASECVTSSDVQGSTRRVCKCEHNTAGPDCNECLPFYNDAPWGRANETHVHECKPCNCNGFSNRCYFDQSLYDATGHGGHCLDCTGNRDGPNCERCRDNYYQTDSTYCIACNCNETGSRSLQCNSEGKCQCKPGVTGEKCDRCDSNHYDFSPQGCKPCDCYPPGSLENEPSCDPYTGICLCKENVEGQRCRGCKPGFFNLDEYNEFGCTPCFCYGHSSVCRSAPGYSKVLVESMFARNNERWHSEDSQKNEVPMQYNGLTQVISLSAPGKEPIYFLAPDRFLGDQRASYNQDLAFKLRIGENGPVPSVEDVIVEGAGRYMSQTIFGQGNQLPNFQTQDYKFRLHENPDYGWQPRLSARDFMSILSNLTAIKIRGTFTPQGVGFLDDVKLETARRGAAGAPATWIEMCTCPSGYVGQFCESCAPGFRHDPASGGPFAPCVPCNCHGHADICDADTGRCICQHNTAGDNCERCARGYYGNSLQGSPYDCKRCPCPNQGPCMEIGDVNNTIMCLECPKGYTGPHCDICSDGYFGDPRGRHGDVRLCQPCDCNLNVDPNAVGNCNRTTGECLKCIFNTGGSQCDQCLPGFYGDALALPKGDCKPCQCYYAGTQETRLGPPVCDQLSGQCQCKPHVLGTNCDQCEIGYYNIISGKGCEACNCDPVGSLNTSCDVITGQCKCRPGVTGQRCDVCEAYHYGFSYEGCKPCECDNIGSIALQCDPSGQCPCLDNVEGRRCDRCKENKFDRQKGCVDCPACYNLIQDAVDQHRANLNELNNVLRNIADNPTVISDVDFEENLKKVIASVEQLWKDALSGARGETDKSLTATLDELNTQLDLVAKLAANASNWIINATELTVQAERNATQAEDTQTEARYILQVALDYLQTDGAAALQNALQRSEEFGQQSEQMSQIAREARLLAKKHEEEAAQIKALAENALNLSTEAYNLGHQVVTTQAQTGAELLNLKTHLKDTEVKLNHTTMIVDETSNSVRGVHDEALSIYTEIHALNIPDIDTVAIKEDAQNTGAQAQKIIDEANDLLGKNLDELANTNKLIEESESILQEGVAQQQIADELLADADAANAKAEDAVKLGNKTLQEAQETFNTLLKFDNQVQESKDKAAQALGTVTEIRELIDEAMEKTTNAQRALAGAENDAVLARSTAQEAQQKYAEQASQEADNIRKSAEETKAEAGKLRDEAEVLAGRVAITANKVTELEDQATKDQEVVNDAKQKVGQAKTSASDASKQVEKALQEVKNIIEELNDLDDIDEDTLNAIERRLAEAENDFYSVNLDQELQTLTKARIQQSQLVKNYQEEVSRLRADVDNIEDINNALPSGCWKRTRLEP